jgi:hypothetical protein
MQPDRRTHEHDMAPFGSRLGIRGGGLHAHGCCGTCFVAQCSASAIRRASASCRPTHDPLPSLSSLASAACARWLTDTPTHYQIRLCIYDVSYREGCDDVYCRHPSLQGTHCICVDTIGHACGYYRTEPQRQMASCHSLVDSLAPRQQGPVPIALGCKFSCIPIVSGWYK